VDARSDVCWSFVGSHSEDWLGGEMGEDPALRVEVENEVEIQCECVP
jgi:hypothetical protein